jgi:uncharacterized protein involved in cysteine biosynthesis
VGWFSNRYCLFLGAVTATGLYFGLALVPQAEWIITWGWPEWLAWITAVLLVLFEIFLTVWILMEGLFGRFIEKMVEKVFKIEGVELKGDPTCVESCGNSCLHIAFGLLLFVVTLPLNGIPVLGTVLFLALNGWRMCWELHEPWFEMKEVGWGDQLEHMAVNAKQYLITGFVMMLLALLPGLGLILLFSNAVGLALLACDMERGKVAFKRSKSTAVIWPKGGSSAALQGAGAGESAESASASEA